MLKVKDSTAAALIGAAAIIIVAIIPLVCSKSNNSKEGDVGSVDSGSLQNANRDIIQPGRDNLKAGRDINQNNFYPDTTKPTKRKSILKGDTNKTSLNVPTVSNNITQGDNGVAIIGNNNTVNKSDKIREASYEIVSTTMNSSVENVRNEIGEITNANYESIIMINLDFQIPPQKLIIKFNRKKINFVKTYDHQPSSATTVSSYAIGQDTTGYSVSPLFKGKYSIKIYSPMRLTYWSDYIKIELN